MAIGGDVATLLNESRSAHRAGRAAAAKGETGIAWAQFTIALQQRLAARAADPDYTDPAWGADLTALHSRKEFDRDLGRSLLKRTEKEGDPQGYDVPSTKVGQSLKDADLALDAYFRQQLGDDPNTHAHVDVTAMKAAVIPPTQWVVTALGHLPNCKHVRQALNDQVRVCVACQQREELRPTMKAEDTQAFQQLTQEAKARQ